MHLSDLQAKDIVNINDGKKVGRIIDCDISLDGKINFLIIEEKRGISSFLTKDLTTSIEFRQIKKIGTDVILVDL